MKKIVKIVAIRGNSGNSGEDGGGDGVLDFNHQGTGRGKTAGDLGERVPRVPLGIPTCDTFRNDCHIKVIRRCTYANNISFLLYNYIKNFTCYSM